jgi:hypothetical protein
MEALCLQLLSTFKFLFHAYLLLSRQQNFLHFWGIFLSVSPLHVYLFKKGKY